MSRITVVLFHLVLTATVTVWANSERRILPAGQELSQDLVTSHPKAGEPAPAAFPAQNATAVVNADAQPENKATNLEKERVTEPAI
jgi:hypothetical protein